MTKQEIQALIDAKIAGQGSAVDVGGALPAILSEILNLATAPPVPPANMPKPIVLQRAIDSEDTPESLAQIGLTIEEVQAAALGERTGVVLGVTFYNITSAVFETSDAWSISFEQHYYNSDGSINAITAYDVRKADDDFGIEIYDV